LASLLPVIGDVRGRGLMLGVELVTDRKEKTPAKAETTELSEKLKGVVLILPLHGHDYLLISTCSDIYVFLLHNLCQQITDFLVDCMDYAMSGL
jgi:alanine-glyoxylate transaminase/(R)-3-amino-2-methylpropionate-pyruvate transaminase